MRKLIAHSRQTARTWTDRYYERRDSAVLFAIAHMNIESKLVHTITPSAIHLDPDGKWHVVSYWDRNVRRPGWKPSEKSFDLCAPCAWTRWMRVHSLRLRSGTSAMIDALERDDELRHVCKEPGNFVLPDGVNVVFPSYGPESRTLRPMSGATAKKALQTRLSQVLPADAPIAKYTLRSLPAVAEALTLNHPLELQLAGRKTS